MAVDEVELRVLKEDNAVERKTKVDELDVTAQGVRRKDTGGVARILNLLQSRERKGKGREKR